METKLTLIGILTFFQAKQPDFENIKWFQSYTQKCIKNYKKSTLQETLYFKNYQRLLVKLLPAEQARIRELFSKVIWEIKTTRYLGNYRFFFRIAYRAKNVSC